jgi:hypothetical protein
MNTFTGNHIFSSIDITSFISMQPRLSAMQHLALFILRLMKWLATYKYENLQGQVIALMVGDTQASGE